MQLRYCSGEIIPSTGTDQRLLEKRIEGDLPTLRNERTVGAFFLQGPSLVAGAVRQKVRDILQAAEVLALFKHESDKDHLPHINQVAIVASLFEVTEPYWHPGQVHRNELLPELGLSLWDVKGLGVEADKGFNYLVVNRQKQARQDSILVPRVGDICLFCLLYHLQVYIELGECSLVIAMVGFEAYNNETSYKRRKVLASSR